MTPARTLDELTPDNVTFADCVGHRLDVMASCPSCKMWRGLDAAKQRRPQPILSLFLDRKFVCAKCHRTANAIHVTWRGPTPGDRREILRIHES